MTESPFRDQAGKSAADLAKQVNFGRICLRIPLMLGGHELSNFRYVETALTKGPLHALSSKEMTLSNFWLEQGLGLQIFLITDTKLKKEIQFPACKIKYKIVADAFTKSPPGTVAIAQYGNDIQLNILQSFEKDFASIQNFSTALQSSSSGLFTSVNLKEKGEHRQDDPLSTYIILTIFSNDAFGEYIWFWFEPDMIFMLNAREIPEKQEEKIRCFRCGTLNVLPAPNGNLVRGEIESYTFSPRKCETCGASFIGKTGIEAMGKVEQEKSSLREIEQLSQDEKRKRLKDLLSMKIDFLSARMGPK